MVLRFVEGVLDAGFGTFGGAEYVPMPDPRPTDLKVGSDGKIWIGGNQGSNFMAVRLSPNGVLDTAFGGGDGVATVFGSNFGPPAMGIAVDASNRPIVAGMSDFEGMMGVRFNAAGYPDIFFGTQGVVTALFSGYGWAAAGGVLVDPAGRVVFGGWVMNSAPQAFALMRTNAAGQLDPNFGTGSKQTTLFSEGHASGHEIARTSGDRLVLAGDYSQEFVYRLALTRYLANGTLDLTYGGGDGKATHGFGSRSAIARELALDSSDRAVVAGRLY